LQKIELNTKMITERFFNTTGPCNPSDGIINASERIAYFVRSRLIFAFISLLLLACGNISSQQNEQLAFPHAEGFGRIAKGGRGGDVYHVTTVEDYDPKNDAAIVGSLRHAIESARGARTIVFETSGTIEMKKDLEMKDKKQITIAGQTAPGDGITLKNRTFYIRDCEDIVVRFIRVRFGDQGPRPTTKDGMTIENCKRIILDHLTISWTVDATMDTRLCEDFTVQWCIFSEPLHNSIHEKGPHSKLSSIRDVSGGTSYHHNLCVSSYQRFPTLGNKAEGVDQAFLDFRNNVLYNYVSGTNIGNSTILIVNNYYRWGPDCKTKTTPFTIKPDGDAKDVRAYIRGNRFDPDFPHNIYNKDNYEGISYDFYEEKYTKDKSNYKPGASRATVEIKDEPDLGRMKLIATQTPQDCYKSVMASAGASLVRDAVDKRVVAEVEARTNKIIDSQDQVGGWPQLKALPAPKDTDRDGMPDKWEKQHGLDPNNPVDGNVYTLNKNYTNLEMYLNGLVEHLYIK